MKKKIIIAVAVIVILAAGGTFYLNHKINSAVKDGKIIADIRTNTGINVNFLRENFTKTPPKVLKINILYDITVLYKKQLNWYYIIDCVY